MRLLDRLSGIMALYCAIVALWLGVLPVNYQEINLGLFSFITACNILASAYNFYFFLKGYFMES